MGTDIMVPMKYIQDANTSSLMQRRHENTGGRGGSLNARTSKYDPTV
jgi:hypothetical protein